MDFATNNAYPTPFANTTILPLLLLSLAAQKNAPKTASTFLQEYDYVIVGAGSAGSVVAARLSEIPCVRVLLLEAGHAAPLVNDIPVLSRFFWMTDLDWAYKTVPQKYTGRALVNNQVIWPSGKALGGSSILNAMLYVRGSPKNYDDWAKQGAKGWSYSEVLPYFKKMEDNRDPGYIADSYYHSTGGPLTVDRSTYSTEYKTALMNAARDEEYTFLDVNAEDSIGFYDYQMTLRDGQRCSTAKAYLVPAENRTNLDIVADAFVKKVVVKNRQAVGVVFEFGGLTYTVRARREVILSAGTTNTAQLLMLSGIGPKEHLEELKIPVIADLPVGNNFQDHPGTPLGYVMSSTIPSLQQKFMDSQTIMDYTQFKRGLFTSAHAIALVAFLNNNTKPDAGVSLPRYEIYFVEVPMEIVKTQTGLAPEVYKKVYSPYENSTSFFCVAQLLQPKSRGTVRLNSINPYDPPLIDPNYLEDPRDVEDMIEGLKFCQKMGRSKALKQLGTEPFSTVMTGCEHVAKFETLYLECLARSLIVTISHPVGSAKMGDPEDPTTVVDPSLRVKGIDGLRVVDASVMPTIPTANTNIPTIMIAEKAADLIRESIKCSTAQTNI